jgi:uroporphyrinogen III methyltransferase / synthase
VSTSSARRARTSTSATPTAPVTRGRVIFVGTGPGDPDLLTLGAIAALADASSVILDNDRQREILAHPAITLADAAEVITIGLTEARKPLSPSARAKIVLKQASTGGRVVRLVSGDPFLDNAVADEAAACVRGGIDFEVVPGVSSLTAVPEYAGIRHRRQVHQERNGPVGCCGDDRGQHRGFAGQQSRRGGQGGRAAGR